MTTDEGSLSGRMDEGGGGFADLGEDGVAAFGGEVGAGEVGGDEDGGVVRGPEDGYVVGGAVIAGAGFVAFLPVGGDASLDAGCSCRVLKEPLGELVA